MTDFFGFGLLAAVVLLVTAKLGFRVWQRQKTLIRLRAEWGKVGAAQPQDLDTLAEAWQELDSGTDSSTAVDERTWRDLDLDDVLAALDRNRTDLGRQQFYRRLRTGAIWGDSPFLEALVSRLGSDASAREAVGLVLGRASRRLGAGLWRITDPRAIVTRWWYWGFPVLTLATVACLLATIVDPRALIPLLVLVVCNVIVRMVIAWQLPAMLVPIRQVAPLIAIANRLVHAIGRMGLDVKVQRADVAGLRSLQRLTRLASPDPIGSGELLAGVSEYLNLLFILDANVLLFGARRLRRAADPLGRLAIWVGEVDLALTVAQLRAEPRAWTRAASALDNRAAGLWHPLLDDPVANDVELIAGEGLIVTGANMAGKSTYLRTVGVAAILARGIDTCPATHWGATPLVVRSLIGRADDMRAGKSYYQVEADGVIDLLRHAAGAAATLFLLDELLRGTNTVERLAAGEAILRALLDSGTAPPCHVVVVATHDGELVNMLKGVYHPWHFRETVTPAGLDFDYQRRDGAATTRTAIALLEVSGAPTTVVQQARARADELDGLESLDELE